MRVEFIHGDPSRPECGDMFGGWLAEHDGRAFMIDCGVGSGGPTLARRLKERLADRKLDYVLITHIHLDHAGGLGSVLQAFPETKAVVHGKWLNFLLQPDRLWAGTLKVMKELAEVYGRPGPIASDRLIPHTEAQINGLKILETPGHAPHHLSFRLGPIMFAGEAAGCPYHFEGRLHNRPATPPRYFPEVTESSIIKLLAEPDGPAYCGHCGQPVSLHECLKLYQNQLAFWDEYLRRPGSARQSGESAQDQLNRLAKALLRDDPNLAPLKMLPNADMWVEEFFMRNSIEGFLYNYEEQLAKLKSA